MKRRGDGKWSLDLHLSEVRLQNSSTYMLTSSRASCTAAVPRATEVPLIPHLQLPAARTSRAISSSSVGSLSRVCVLLRFPSFFFFFQPGSHFLPSLLTSLLCWTSINLGRWPRASFPSVSADAICLHIAPFGRFFHLKTSSPSLTPFTFSFCYLGRLSCHTIDFSPFFFVFFKPHISIENPPSLASVKSRTC